MIRRLVATATVFLLTAPTTANAAPGDLDPSFGGGAGWVRTLEIRDASNARAALTAGRRRAPHPQSPGPFGGYARAVRATRAGILVAGRAYTETGTGPSDWALTRHTPSGRLLGITRTDFGTGEDTAEAIALTRGHATVAGSIYGSHGVARHLTE